MMWGWINFPTSEASFRKTLWKRRRKSVSTPSAALTSLMATSRFANGSRPRKTRLGPPRPISPPMGYLPILGGTLSSMDWAGPSARCRHLHAFLYGGPAADVVEPALHVREVAKVDLVPLMARHPRIGRNVGHGIF